MTEMKQQYHNVCGCRYRYLVKYHIVWCPEFESPLFNDEIANELREILIKCCEAHNYVVDTLEICADYIHIYVDCFITTSVCDLAKELKGWSAVRLFQTHPELKQFYVTHGSLWFEGYLVSTADSIAQEEIQKYVNNLKQHRILKE